MAGKGYRSIALTYFCKEEVYNRNKRGVEDFPHNPEFLPNILDTDGCDFDTTKIVILHKHQIRL
jgi:hypothetical protein